MFDFRCRRKHGLQTQIVYWKAKFPFGLKSILLTFNDFVSDTKVCISRIKKSAFMTLRMSFMLRRFEFCQLPFFLVCFPAQTASARGLAKVMLFVIHTRLWTCLYSYLC